MAVINLGLSIVLCQKYGAAGSAFGTAISLIVANGIIINIYYNHKCNIDIPFFWKNILRQALGMIAPIIVGIILINSITIDSVIKFLVCTGVYTFVYSLSMWLIGMNEYEKELIIKPIKKITRR